MGVAKLALGVDIGGTHATAALVDLATRKIVGDVKRVSVDAGGSVDEVIEAWSACIGAASEGRDVQICLAMPGPFDYQEGISLMRGQNKYEKLYGLNVRQLLAEALHVSPGSIFFENDAGCYLQGEVFDGAAAPFARDKVIGITLGTGLGSAVYRDGRSRSADTWCWPFKDSIAEDYLCTRWFVKYWKQETGLDAKGVRELALNAPVDERVVRMFEKFGENLAEFLLDFIAVESPAAVIIGGNISKAWQWFSPTMTSLIHANDPGLHIRRATLGEEAPLLGAVSGWLRQEKSLQSS